MNIPSGSLQFIKKESGGRKVANQNHYTQHQSIIESENIEYLNYEELVSGDHHVCKDCFMAFSNPDQLDEHILVTHNPNFQCDICFRNFKNFVTLNRHRSHHKPIKCGECGKLFYIHRKLMRHWKQDCVKSIQKYTSHEDLYVHNVHKHTTKFEPLKFIHCEKCTLAFREQDAYDAHKMYHERLEQAEKDESSEF